MNALHEVAAWFFATLIEPNRHGITSVVGVLFLLWLVYVVIDGGKGSKGTKKKGGQKR